MGLYTLSLTGSAALFKINPLEFWFLWYRPENGALQNFDMNFRITTFINLLQFGVTVGELGPVTYKSISNYFANPIAANIPFPLVATDIALSGGSYSDSFWQYKVINSLFPTFATSSWYNTKT